MSLIMHNVTLLFMLVCRLFCQLYCEEPLNIIQNLQNVDVKAKSSAIHLKPFNVPQLSNEFRQKMVDGIYTTYENIPYLDRPFAIFDSLIYMRNDRPEGYFLKAALYLYIYQMDNNKANFDSLKQYADIIINRCEAILKKNPNDPFMYFYLGAIYGNMGLQYLKQKDYWSAYRYGVKGKNYLEKTIKIDSTLVDAEFGIGIFLYYADILPKYIKPLLYLVGLSGNRTEGLKKIRLAAQNGYISGVEAHYFLAKILDDYEGMSDESLTIFQKLHNQFPNSLYYWYSLGLLYYENGNYLESQKQFQKILNNPHRYYLRSALYYSGKISFAFGDYTTARTYFKELVTQFPPGAKDKIQEIYYYLGLCYEYQNDRAQALVQYKAAENIDSKKYTDELRILLRTPLSPDDKQCKNIQDLINQEKYDQAELIINKRQQDSIQKKETVLEYYLSWYNLLSADIAVRLNKITEAEFFLSKCNESLLQSSSELLVQYQLLHTEVCLKSNNKKAAEKYINALKKTDFDNLPVHYRRAYNNLQFRYYGEVKYR